MTCYIKVTHIIALLLLINIIIYFQAFWQLVYVRDYFDHFPEQVALRAEWVQDVFWVLIYSLSRMHANYRRLNRVVAPITSYNNQISYYIIISYYRWLRN